MSKWNVVHLHNGISLNNKKEWSTDTSYNMDEPSKQHTKWKKPVTKGHIVWFNLHEISTTDKSIKTEITLVVARGGRKG